MNLGKTVSDMSDWSLRKYGVGYGTSGNGGVVDIRLACGN